MNNQLAMAQHKFIEGVGRMCDVFGLNRFIAQLYAFLYLNDKPISLDEIADSLGVSKGSVSINIRELEKWGAVKNVWVKGSRKDYYKAEPDIKKVIFNKAKSGMQKRTEELSNLLDEFSNILKSLDGNLESEEVKIVAIYKEKLQKIKEMKNEVSSAIKLFSKFV